MVLILLQHFHAFFGPGEPGDFHWDHFWTIAVDPQFTSGYDLLEEIWLISSSLNEVISNCSMMFLLLW